MKYLKKKIINLIVYQQPIKFGFMYGDGKTQCRLGCDRGDGQDTAHKFVRENEMRVSEIGCYKKSLARVETGRRHVRGYL